MKQLMYCLQCVVLIAVTTLASNMAGAQNRFTPVIEVGDTMVTRYQVDQRVRFLSLLRAPGDPRELAREQLINEAVQVQTARAAGINPDEDSILAGMSEFAGRANLSAEQFTTALVQSGVSAETFRDFISAGVAWRDYARARFGDTARQIPRAQVERTLAQTGTEGGLRVLVSEILLPANSPETELASRERAAQLTTIESESAFAVAARQYSVAPSRNRGGELNWVALETLPEEIRGVISSLTPGQISQPVSLENAIGVFLLRDVERAESGAPEDLAVDYALFLSDGGLAGANAVLQEVDVCDDLYGIAKDLPEERLIRETQPLNALPQDLRVAIAGLDIGEGTTALTRQGRATVLILCSRRATLESSVDFDLVGNRLLNARLGTIAADHLADVRANTYIADLAN